jgi:hypothetical protein
MGKPIVINLEGLESWRKESRQLYASDRVFDKGRRFYCLLNGNFEVELGEETLYSGADVSRAVEAFNGCKVVES